MTYFEPYAVSPPMRLMCDAKKEMSAGMSVEGLALLHDGVRTIPKTTTQIKCNRLIV